MSTNASIVFYKRMPQSRPIEDFPTVAVLYVEAYSGVEHAVPVTVLRKGKKGRLRVQLDSAAPVKLPMHRLPVPPGSRVTVPSSAVVPEEAGGAR